MVMGKNNDNRSVTEKVNEALANTTEYDNLIKDCIGKIHIMNEKETIELEDEEVFRDSAEVVFDSTSKNFHVFPKQNKDRGTLETENSIVKDFFRERKKITTSKLDIKLDGLDWKSFLTGNGKPGTFGSYTNYLRKNFGKESTEYNDGLKSSYIYRYITLSYHGKLFFLNFMRFHQTEDGKVNCDFKSLQYDCVVSGGSVNATADANVCDVCYPYSSANGECHVNSVGNICYNPYISFYDDEELILKDFINFIECCDKLINHNNNSINEKYNDGFISSQQFADILRKSITPTPFD